MTKGFWLPVELLRDKNTTMQEKLILVEINQLSMLDKGCIASNSHFAELFDIKKESVSRSISSLETKGYISTKIKEGSRNHERTITINKMLFEPKQNVITPLTNCLETKENKTSIKTKEENIPTSFVNEKETEVEARTVAKYLYSTIISFNPKFASNYQVWIKDIEKAIRLDGRTKEDLIKVIDWIYNNSNGSFWISNILSGKKLREKFDTMDMQMKNKSNNKQSYINRCINENARTYEAPADPNKPF